MTQQELFDTWARYMHRSDLTADMDLTKTLADARISGSLILYDVDLADILENHAELYIQAGLINLSQLTRDTEQISISSEMFQSAVSAYMRRHSLAAGAVAMTNPNEV